LCDDIPNLNSASNVQIVPGSMESLDDLSNDEIRIQLVKLGFPSMPVTVTTRKVLLKKLKIAVEGQKSKTRRETIAVTKFSSDEDELQSKEKTRPAAAGKRERTPNRRATMAAPSEQLKKVATSTTNGSLSRADTPSKNSRRSSRTTPAKEEPTVTSSNVIHSVLEDSDEEDDLPLVRKSRSRTGTPTLDVSKTVRTSYKSVVEKVHERDDDEDDDAEIVEQFTAPRRKSPSLAIQQQQYQPSAVRSRKTFTTSSSTFSMPSADVPSKFNKSSFSYNPGSTTTFPYKYRGAGDEEDDDDDDDAIELNETNAPYLSNFAKRLSTLQAEPLDTGLDKYKSLARDGSPKVFQSSVKYDFNYKPMSARQPLSAIAPKKSGMMKDLGQLFDSLDRQYNIRTFLYICMIVMVIVAIYVIVS